MSIDTPLVVGLVVGFGLVCALYNVTVWVVNRQTRRRNRAVFLRYVLDHLGQAVTRAEQWDRPRSALTPDDL